MAAELSIDSLQWGCPHHTTHRPYFLGGWTSPHPQKKSKLFWGKRECNIFQTLFPSAGNHTFRRKIVSGIRIEKAFFFRKNIGKYFRNPLGVTAEHKNLDFSTLLSSAVTRCDFPRYFSKKYFYFDSTHDFTSI